MAVRSAGILLYRLNGGHGGMQVLLAHMGGPYWAAKDAGAWSIPKGEYDPDSEGALDAARREFREELGVDTPAVAYAELGTFPYASGKRVTVFVGDGSGFDPDEDELDFGEFEVEWPPRSGRMSRFPEVDRVEWCSPDEAVERLVKGQRPAIDALQRRIAEASAQE